MTSYPSIEREILGGQAYFFDKLDGNNIRAEWLRKKGKWGEFHKFGSRNQLIDSTSDYAEAIVLIKEKYESKLTKIFRKQRWDRVTCFFEFYGPHSFAGRHIDEPHTVTLIDVSIYKKGILLPWDFLEIFSEVETAKLVYYGFASDIIIPIRQGTLEGVTFEGVVGKKNEYASFGIPKMFKIKSQAWLDKLDAYCNGDVELYEKLA